MLRTHFCDLVGIEVPIVQAATAPWTPPELVAAVANAGGLGSLGTALHSPERVQQLLGRTRALTDRPFVVNFTFATFDEETFAHVLAFRPRAVSFALGDPGDLVRRAHDAGCLFIQQVQTIKQARQAAERGVDAIIAQGTEAGGFTGGVSSFALIPQVVDAVHPLPVLAAGGIADGRGIAAAMILGAQGVNIGTRFLASAECNIGDAFKRAIVAAESEDVVKVDVWFDIFPAPGGEAYPIAPRAIRTPFLDQWLPRREEARREAARLQREVMDGLREGRAHELVPFSGQTAGMIHDILPAAEIVRRLVAEAEAALERSTLLLAPTSVG